MTVERRALSGSVVTSLALAVQFGQAIVLVPLFLSRWGEGKYGLWLSLLATQSIIATLDAGHQAYVGNELARLYPVDKTEMRRVLASAVWVAGLIGVVEFGLGACLWLWGALPALLGTTQDVVTTHHLPFALLAHLAMWAIVGSVGGILGRILPPTGRYTRFVAWGIAGHLSLLLVTVAGIILNASIAGLVVGLALAQLLFSIALLRDLRKSYPELYPFWRPADLRLGLSNLLRSFVLTCSALLAQLQQNGLNLLVSGVFGAVLLPRLATARTLANVFMQGTNVIAAPLAPDIVRYHVKHEPEKLVGVWAGIWFVGGVVINFGLVLSLVVVKPFYAAWTRGTMTLEWSLYLPLVAAVSIKAFSVPLFTYLSGLNHLRGLFTLAALQAVAVLGGTSLLAHPLGLAGSALAILIAEVVGCATLIAFVATTMRAHAMKFPWPELRAAVVPPLVTCAAFAITGVAEKALFTVVGVALGSLALAGLNQWRTLPKEVKERIGRLFSRFRRSTERHS